MAKKKMQIKSISSQKKGAVKKTGLKKISVKTSGLKPVKKTLAKKQKQTGAGVIKKATKALSPKSKKIQPKSKISASSKSVRSVTGRILPAVPAVIDSKDTARVVSPGAVPGHFTEEKYFTFPEHYEKSGVIAMARDPRWIFAYWTVTQKDMDNLKALHDGIDFERVKFTVRLLDASIDSKNPAMAQEIFPLYGTTSYYINVPENGRKFVCEIGFTS
ncbi:MAG: DUF4912 domain-containing protein, partial [Syntrophales bacterium LBB04]|nr:DUF4912 domain-containing protein [Syntrophales bacterium LBB04]